jgi:hypothetical protein
MDMRTEWINEIWQRLRAATRRKQLDRDLNDEVGSHLKMREEKNRASGMDAVEARRAARVWLWRGLGWYCSRGPIWTICRNSRESEFMRRR